MAVGLDQFLADLTGRRHRLLQLAHPEDNPPELIEELTELGEQLIIAEEELRVQHEELVAATARMQALVDEREELRSSAAQPYVLTDQRGVVLRANPAAEQLIRQPAIRATPRPIATWFEVADRPAIRTLISRISSGQADQAQARAVLRRSDRTTVDAHVTVTATPGSNPLQPELLWRLEAEPVFEALAAQRAQVSDKPARLQLVGEPEGASEAGAPEARDLASGLTLLALELAACKTEEQLLAVAGEQARQLVPSAQYAGVLLLDRRGKVADLGPAGELATACQQREISLQKGPALTALAQRAPVLVLDTLSEPRWADWATSVAAVGIRSILSVEVAAGKSALGALSLYAAQPNAFDEAATAAASMLGIHLGLALDHLRTVRNLRAGMANRAEIGEALGVLMERHRLTSQQAFQLLVQASQHANVRLRDIARIVSETGQDPAAIRLR